jgi:hypothetical protein
MLLAVPLTMIMPRRRPQQLSPIKIAVVELVQWELL